MLLVREMSTLILAVLTWGATSAWAQTDRVPIGSPHEWIRHLNSMYMFMIDASREIDTTWSDAAFACKSQGGRLVSIDSAEERAYLEGRIQELVASQGQQFAFEQWWTAGRHKDDRWLWEMDDGQDHIVEMTVSRGHHDASAKVSLGLVHDQDGWKLKPIPSTYRLRYICERDAVPEILLSQPPEERLLGALFRKYDRDARGMRTGHGALTVYASMTFSQLHVVADDEPHLRAIGTLSLSWIDERLTWIPGQYENVTHVVMAARRIWLPPLDFVTSFPDGGVFPEDDSRVYLNYQGSILWERSFSVLTACQTDMTYFPFDTCHCSLVMQTSGYPTSFLNISLNHSSLNVVNSSKDSHWQLLKHATTRTLPNTLSKGILSGKYAQFLIKFDFQRQSKFFVVAYIVPSIVTSLLMVLTFMIPPSVPERVTPSVIVYVSYTAIALAVCSNIRMESKQVPVLASHLMVTFMLLSAGLAFSWFTCRLYNNSVDSPFPACMLGLGARRRRTSKLKESPSKEIQLASLSSLKKDADECMKEVDRRNTCGSLQKPYSHGLESSPFTPDLATPCAEEEKHHFLNTYRGLRERLDNAANENHWHNLADRLNRTFAVVLCIVLLINISHFSLKCMYQ